jgi:CrcB protein
MQPLLAVAAGGALGATLRYLAVNALQRAFAQPFPLGTLFVNVFGCLAAGLLLGWFSARAQGAESLRLFLVVGVLGGFTTFSAFGVETVALVREGRALVAMLYVLASVLAGVAAVAIGLRFAVR